MAIIDNKSKTMHEALINALTSAEKVDIEVAFFYFSGWKLLSKYLRDKRTRILVGKYIDPEAIPDLLSKIKQEGSNIDLEPFQPRKTISSRGIKKQTYISSFLRLSNESSLFDESDDQEAYKILENKIADGSLEIKLTANQEHGKMYILHNKPEFSQNGDYPGTVFMGSSNFTFQGLLNQGELNERYNDKERHETYLRKFETLWADSENIDIGKNSMRSREFERLFADVRAGRVNTILCTALDRICRSVKDFLWFFEFLNEHGAEFVCLKQNYDTTSAQGRLFVTMMIALAEFEREQTSERTKDATAARSERGLWNGGRLLGYDADPNKKSTLIPNPDEAVIINFAFDKYLECGSITETAEAMNRHGYRTKSYTSRRDVFHPGEQFYVSTVQYLLKNLAYAGKKEINKKNIHKKNCAGKEYRLVNATWPAIVNPEKFEAVQRLMQENGQTNRNAAEPVRHAYVLSRGILHCGRCGATMDGRCGTGRLGTKYFYYVCQNKECSLRVSADEIESVVLERIRQLALNGTLLERLTQETNARLLKQKPALEKQRLGLMKSLGEVKTQADRLLEHWTGQEEQAGAEFVKEKLSDLAHRRKDLEGGVAETEEALRQVQSQSLNADEVRQALARIDEVYAQLKPFERRELMGAVLKSAKVNEREIDLEIFALGGPPLNMMNSVNQGEKVRLPPIWLPELDSNQQPSG